PNAVSLRAIAREMGMTAPALYRYFPSFDHLVKALVADMYDEVCAAMTRAKDAVADHGPGDQLLSATRAFRSWAVAHRAEFGLLFGVPALNPPQAPTTVDFGALRCAQAVLSIFEDLWKQRPYLVSAPDTVASTVSDQLTAYQATTASSLPIPALCTAISVWLRVLGLVSLEIFGHIPFARLDGAAFFEQQLAEIAFGLGISG
ncbi:MAG: TetR/AcrR family transcriptional regulator, partial [Mycobacteriales bacterium]